MHIHGDAENRQLNTLRQMVPPLCVFSSVTFSDADKLSKFYRSKFVINPSLKIVLCRYTTV